MQVKYALEKNVAMKKVIKCVLCTTCIIIYMFCSSVCIIHVLRILTIHIVNNSNIEVVPL